MRSSLHAASTHAPPAPPAPTTPPAVLERPGDAPSPRYPALVFIAVALGYAVLGRLGTLMAIPPGYATPVFPAAGLALAAVLLWGPRYALAAWLGSILLSQWLAAPAYAWGVTTTVVVSVLVGGGVALQAAVGGALVRRFIGSPTALASVRDAACFLLFGGVITALLSASVSLAVLLPAGIVTPAGAAFNWTSWWVGDAIGVVVVTPLLLIALARPRHEWWPRRWTVAVPLLVTFIFEITVFLVVSRREDEQLRAGFQARTLAVRSAFLEAVRDATVGIFALADLMRTNAEVQDDAFTAVAQGFIDRQPGLRGLMWAPLVPHAERGAFEASLQRPGRPTIHITDRMPDGVYTPAPERTEYVPVQFAAASDAPRVQGWGYDLSQEPQRGAILAASAARQGLALSPRMPFLRPGSSGYGVFAAVPVYADSARTVLRGFTATTLALEAIARHALDHAPHDHMRIFVEDMSAPPGERLLHYTGPPLPPSARAQRGTIVATAELEVGGRQWRITARSTAAYLSANRSLQSWGMLVGGLVLTSIVVGFLLALTGRTTRVEALVEERTRELTTANRLLRREIEDRERVEYDLRVARDAAHAASRAKSSFLANMSHEIRTPMNGIIGMLGLLRQSPLDQPQREFTDTINRSADALLHVINDILDFSKIESGHVEIESLEMDVEQLVEDVLDSVALLANEKGLHLVGHVEPSVPRRLHGDPARVRQVLMNLVSNAIKFTTHGEVGVRVSIDREEGTATTLRFSIADTGIGIATHKLKSIFAPFTQEDASTTRRFGGTGLGLSISHQLALLMGGDIGVLSQEGRGSTFWFTARFERDRRTTQPIAEGIDLRDVRALVVHRRGTTREHIASLLTQWGARVDERGDWDDARAPLDSARTPSFVFVESALLPPPPAARRRIDGARVVRLVPVSERMRAGAAGDTGADATLAEPIRRDRLAAALLALRGDREPQMPTLSSLTARPAAVLLVEDNEINQLVASRILETLGHDVHVAANGIDALHLLAHETFDLVLMDCQMPLLDGYETTRAIRDPASSVLDHAVTIIAMTANATSDDRRRCLDAGMNDFLAKPVTVEALRDAVARWMPQGDAAAVAPAS